jgi:CubicO group peptidase (beta-lactamase class C family)
MADLGIEAEASELGFDQGRLERLDAGLARYADDGRLAGWLVLVSRRGRIVHLSTYGRRDEEAGLPVETDTQWRVYSMTKPITSVAAMMLYEQGVFDLSDPIARYLPEFAHPRVYVAGPPGNPVTRPAAEPIRVWHLLTHTAGLTYGFHRVHPVDGMYRRRGFDFGDARPELDLATCSAAWAELPLLFEPGTHWTYSIATDVLGRLIEVVSGEPLDVFLGRHVFDPLGMTDTTFGRADPDRLAALYALPEPGGAKVRNPGTVGTREPTFLSGGGGLVSTAADYHRFTQMLLRGGELDGFRALGSRTVAYMTRNHLPGGADLASFGTPINAETPFNGIGFGLGFSVQTDPAAAKVLGSAGEYGWGGAASTAFWVDPAEELTTIFLTQLLPSSAYPLRLLLRRAVYQALID